MSSSSSLLAAYKDLPPLSFELHPDGKSLINETEGAVVSSTYSAFPSPIVNGPQTNGFDFHIYFFQNNSKDLQYAKELHERIRREFPELRVYRVFENPMGPHTTGSFEVNVFTPAQLGALTAFLVVNRGPCSVLIHPNTGDDIKDHTESATWIGPPIPVDIELLKKLISGGGH
ncbi:DOPA-like domain-containing protein [Mrakia frigida]|uniref:DOPA 4,5-dioxygenase family protein n=1 Tax=Mrakia frigida TaxID=29902 RepID=UPI003FCC0C52